jgi:hypothetical protein
MRERGGLRGDLSLLNLGVTLNFFICFNDDARKRWADLCFAIR